MRKSVIICDLCGRSYDSDNSIIHIDYTAPYETEVFSDMDHIVVDLCEVCLHELLNHKGVLQSVLTPYDTH